MFLVSLIRQTAIIAGRRLQISRVKIRTTLTVFTQTCPFQFANTTWSSHPATMTHPHTCLHQTAHFPRTRWPFKNCINRPFHSPSPGLHLLNHAQPPSSIPKAVPQIRFTSQPLLAVLKRRVLRFWHPFLRSQFEWLDNP